MTACFKSSTKLNKKHDFYDIKGFFLKKKVTLTIGDCVSVFVFTTQNIERRTISTLSRRLSNPVCESWLLNKEKVLASYIHSALKSDSVNNSAGGTGTTQIPSAAFYRKFLGMLTNTP